MSVDSVKQVRKSTKLNALGGQDSVLGSSIPCIEWNEAANADARFVHAINNVDK